MPAVGAEALCGGGDALAQTVRIGVVASSSDEDIAFFAAALEPSLQQYDVIDAMPDTLPEVRHPRTPGYEPQSEENKYGAWYRRSVIKGASTGKLVGKTIALKDNICLAGVPMMNGSALLEGYVPDVDATIVTRMLDAAYQALFDTH